MKPPEQVKKEFTKGWLDKAENDYRTAQYLGASGADYVSSSVFHAQQAVEKYIKAYLVWYQIEFPKTHDIAALRYVSVFYEAAFAGNFSNSKLCAPASTFITSPSANLPAIISLARGFSSQCCIVRLSGLAP